MRQPFFTDREEITKELAIVLNNQTQLNLYQQCNPVQPVLLRGVDLKHEPPMIVILKKKVFQAEDCDCCLLYRPVGQVPRGFNGTILKQSEHHLGVSLPTEIFQIQRRKCGRYGAPRPSEAVFTLKGGQRLHKGQVANISCEGAKLVGSFPPKLEKDMVIGPLSFTLCLQFAKAEITHFTAAEAIIAWTGRDGNEIREMGLRLHLAPAENKKLDHYIEMRSLEEAAIQSARSTPSQG